MSSPTIMRAPDHTALKLTNIVKVVNLASNPWESVDCTDLLEERYGQSVSINVRYPVSILFAIEYRIEKTPITPILPYHHDTI